MHQALWLSYDGAVLSGRKHSILRATEKLASALRKVVERTAASQKGTDNGRRAASSLETKPNNQRTQNSLVIVTVDICPTTVPRIQLISKKHSQKWTKERCLLGEAVWCCAALLWGAHTVTDIMQMTTNPCTPPQIQECISNAVFSRRVYPSNCNEIMRALNWE